MRLGTRWCRRAFSKRLLFGEDCQAVIGETAEEVARVAGVTLGPLGRSVVIEDHKEQPRITKDGVTVVKHLEYVDFVQCRRIDLKMQSALSLRNRWRPRTALQVMAPPPLPCLLQNWLKRDERCNKLVQMVVSCDLVCR